MSIDNTDNPKYRLTRQLNNIRDRAQDGTLDPELARRLQKLAAALDGDNPRDKYVAPNGERKEYSPGTIYQYLHVLVRWHDLDGIDYLYVFTPRTQQRAQPELVRPSRCLGRLA